jgi:ATP-dependent exoDNAse (exonuclease V) alpha subunit
MQEQLQAITESLRGIVDRVTFHNPDNGWSVLRVTPFNNPMQQETVIVHQTKVFAGATMEFHGAWTVDPKYGRQFRATAALERKPASSAALEKYLGSGLIKGVGPKTAKKIVQHFKMLFRNLIYTALTWARRLAVLVGTRKALALSVKNQDTSSRQTALQELLRL